jgi:hypothetical protein
MRRLTIGWCGTSKALGAIRPMLEQYGHVSGDEATDLWIEDGSLPLPDDAGGTTCISLRVGVGPSTDCGLPALQLRAYGHDRRLSAVLDIAEEPSGNGQRLRQHATNALVDWVALLVSGFSRDPESLSTSAIATEWSEHSLHGLEPLAFMHRFNRTTNPDLIQQAQVPLIERVQASLHLFADRPALNIAGHTVTYRQLHLQAMAIQQRLRPLMEALETPAVIGVCLEKNTELYASILAVLGSGAVYLPLGPRIAGCRPASITRAFHCTGCQHRRAAQRQLRVLADAQSPLFGYTVHGALYIGQYWPAQGCTTQPR